MRKPLFILAGVVLLLLMITQAACTGIRSTTPTPKPPDKPTHTAPTPEPTPTARPMSAAPAGPVEISGTFTVTNDFVIATYIVEHAVALVDMYGFVIRDEEWELPVDSQVLGFLKVDVANLSGEYTLDLPARPEGTFADVDHDGQSDKGVQIFAVAYSPNIAGGPFSEGDDRSFGWPSYLASVKTDSENEDEVIGGKLVVWAPDDQQQFPTGFGPDGLLFTDDDPVGPLPAGYAIIDLDQSPFGISQEAEPTVALYEPKEFAVKDFSNLSYTEAFEALYQTISRDWAFNGIEGKEVDWEALYAEIAPRIAEAEKDKDALEFYRALHDFTLAIPDGHVGLDGGELANADFQSRVAGGYGFAIRELEGGKFAVVYVTANGPAEKAGIQVGAEVTEFGGRPIGEAVSQVQPYAGPFSQEIFRRYQQARYLLRAPVGTETSVTFINPGGQPQTVTLTASEERDSFQVTSIYYGSEPSDLPVTFRVLDSGVGYLNITSYYDDLNLIVRLFERALKTFQARGVTALIIDLRYNGGGNPLGLAGFLYDKEILLGQQERYSEKTGKFEPVGVRNKVLPNVTQYKFEKIAVLVGPACFSACEQEAYSFAQVPGAIVVGYYPSGGVFADVARGQVNLPEGMSLQFSTDRFVNPDGSLFLEGTGVVPTVRVPLTLENLLSTEDVVLRAAEDALLGVGAGDLKIEGGPILASAAASRRALGAGAQFLEDLAAEKYDSKELSQAGQTYVYTVNLEKDQRLFLINGWCATTPEILRDNYQHITLEYSVNGTVVPLDHFAVFDGPAGDLYCKYYYTLVYRWPKGTTEIEVKVTFDAPINDGEADYPKGTHYYRYLVTRP